MLGGSHYLVFHLEWVSKQLLWLLLVAVCSSACSSKMVCRCVAAGCSKCHKDGVSLYLFPSDVALRKKWADQVKRTRDKWEPTDHSVLCSNHFENSCFEQDSNLSIAMGLGKRKPRLKVDAVPTLFDKPESLKRSLVLADVQPQKKIRSAYEKRERARVCQK